MSEPGLRHDMPWTVEAGGEGVSVIRCSIPTPASEWEQWVLVQADEHWDNPDCDWSLLRRHHEQAIQRRAPIIKLGDTFCAMQGRWDKRADKEKLRPEHRKRDYLDALVRTAADWYEPFAGNIALFADGNHETAILRAHETNLLERLCGVLSDRTGRVVRHGGYTGWIRFMFARATQTQSVNMWYTHGYGGGGPVTKDIIQQSRQLAYIVNAHIMASGHVHRRWSDHTVRHQLNSASNVEEVDSIYLKCGTYKDEYKAGQGGFSVERGHGPRPKGGWWLRFYYSMSRQRVVFDWTPTDGG
jgi:hypothetical protein